MITWTQPLEADRVLADNGKPQGKYWISLTPVGRKRMWLASAAFNVRWFEQDQEQEAKAYVEAMYAVLGGSDGI